MDELLFRASGPTPVTDFDGILNQLTVFFDRSHFLSLYWDSYSSPALGITESSPTLKGWIMAVLPDAFAILGIIVGITVAVKIFKRFSR